MGKFDIHHTPRANSTVTLKLASDNSKCYMDINWGDNVKAGRQTGQAITAFTHPYKESKKYTIRIDSKGGRADCVSFTGSTVVSEAWREMKNTSFLELKDTGFPSLSNLKQIQTAARKRKEI